MNYAPTTVTIQTPPGRGGIAVLWLAGPGAEGVLARAFRPLESHARGGGEALQLGHVVDGDLAIDEAIVARRGEGVEINVHGGPAVVTATLGLLSRLGAHVLPASPTARDSLPTAHPRWANPAVGEEMLDALSEARSDLVVEALAAQWSDGISRLAREGVALCDGAGAGDVAARGRGLVEGFREAGKRLAVMRRLLTPAEVVLAGPPNVGKSTLANALVGREVSLVHPTPGTTRDWVREPALLGGLPIWLTDTAGLWEAPEPGSVDAEAVARARERIRQANLVLLLGAGELPETPAWLAGNAPTATQRTPMLLRVAAKCDVAPAFDDADAAVAALDGTGLDDLAKRALERLGLADLDPSAPAAFTQRQADLLAEAAEALEARQYARARAALCELVGR